MAQYDIVKGVKSSGLTLYENDHMFVYKGGTATSTSIITGRLNIFSGGKTLSTWVNSAGLVTVFSGGLASLTNLSSAHASMFLSGGTAILNVTHSNAKLDVMSGGVASLSYILGGSMTVFSGGKAVDTELNRNGVAWISSGGLMKNTQISAYDDTCGILHVLQGGTATTTNIFSGGSMLVSNGGESIKANVSYGGSMVTLNGGTANSTTVSSGGKMILSNGASAADTTIIDGGTMVIYRGGEANNTTVSSGGSMVLSKGGTASKVTVKKGDLIVSSSASATDIKLSGGTLFIGNGATVNMITNKGAELIIERGAVIDNYKGNPVKFPDCDDGWNNYLYNKSMDPPLNTSVTDAAAIKVTSTTKSIQLDKNNVSYNGMSNYVGYGDETDFVKISLDHAATLSFVLSGTGAAKFTIWSLTSEMKMKSLQATSLKKNAKTGEYKVTTKGLLLLADTYYLSVQSTDAKKGGNAYYSVAMNSESVFYSKARSFDDDWNAFVKDNYSGEGYLGNVDGKKTVLISNEWAGYSDAVDFRKFKLASAAKLSFVVKSTDALKLSLCRVDSSGEGESLSYTLKVLQTTTAVKHGKNEYYVSTKLMLLDPGYYYLRVESTNAKKGGYADYSVELNTEDSVFFTKGNSADDWTDMKEKGWTSNKKYEYSINQNTSSLISDEWVGYNDVIDYRKFTLSTDAKVSFGIYASDAVKFTIYQLEKKDKKGEITYSLTKLQTLTIKAGEWRPTNPLKLDAGSYYFSVESTNAKKGGSASYDIEVINCSPIHGSSDSGAKTATDARNASAADASALTGVLADSGLVTQFGTDPADAWMSGAGETPLSPIREDASDGIMAGLRTSLEDFSGMSPQDGLQQNDTRFWMDAAVLA